MPGTHADLSPSSTERWWHCPGSVPVNRGRPDDSNAHSRAGTAAHAVAERAWREQQPARHYLHELIEVDSGLSVAVDEEMVAAVQTLLDVYALEAENADRVWCEARVSLAALKPPAPMTGTVDFGAWKHRWLRVVDFKYGQGVVVEAEGNKQLRTYALGMWMTLIADAGSPVEPEGVAVTIVQPRAFHPDGPVRTELIPMVEFKAWAKDLLEHARATLDPQAPRIPGAHCRWCKFKPECPELRAEALAVAEVEYSDLVVGPPAVRAAHLMTPEDVARVLDAADILEEWLKAVRFRATCDLEAGRPVPGYGLKPKRANRKWVSPRTVLATLDALGVPESMMYAPPELCTPAAMEKVLKPRKLTLPEGLTAQESSGYTLTRVTTAAPPVVSEFTAATLPLPQE